MIDKYDESLEVLFTGEVIKYTLIVTKVKRSDFVTGCNVFIKIIEHKGEFCYIPPENDGFGKCLEFI